MHSYLYFLIYSFLGWTMETVTFSIEEKRFVNRGFLNGPLCPIYGTGMVLILDFLTPFKDNIIVLFLLGGVFATTIEYIVGYLLEKLFYTRWWDYSEKKFNIKGYICLENSIAWSILSVVMVKYIHPYIVSMVKSINIKLLEKISIVTIIVIILDTILTLSSLINFREKIKNLNDIREDISKKIDNKLSSSNLANKVRNYEEDLTDIFSEVKSKLSTKKEDIEFLKLLEVAKEKYQEKLMISKQQRRLINNYKKSSSKQFSDVLNSIKGKNKK